MSTAFVSETVTAAAMHCPNCGGSLQLKGFAHTLSAACQFCGSIIDTSTPLFQIVQTAQNWQQIRSPIPLGSRGKLEGVEWEVIGFQIRRTYSEGVPYDWREYILFNPYRGFRYLTEYNGHWNFVRTLPRIPETSGRNVRLDSRLYRVFQVAQASTVYLLGEFPWRVALNEKVYFSDYIAPPCVLSGEQTDKTSEITWSHGTYIAGKEVWQAFRLQGSPPPVSGIYANQPSPYTGKVGSLWRMYVWLLLMLFVFMIVLSFVLGGKTVFQQSYDFDPRATGEASFVTPEFQLNEPTGNVEVSIKTDLENNWTYFNLALIDVDDGHAYNFGREVSYYEGRDSDGNWTEGHKTDSVKISSIPAGNYYLRVEPESDKDRIASPVHYQITVRRRVLSWSYFFLAALFLGIPPVVRIWRSHKFERDRWSESDLSAAGKMT
jgi:hypothetical protein